MGIKNFSNNSVNYIKGMSRTKKNRAIRNVKHISRFKNVLISSGLSLVILGTVGGILGGVFVALQPTISDKDLVIFSTSSPSTFNWMKEFVNTSAESASSAMMGLVSPRLTDLDGIREAREKINKQTTGTIEAAGKTFDLSNDSDKNELLVLMDKYISQLPSDANNLELLGLPSLKTFDKDGGTTNTYSSYANGMAKSITEYEAGEMDTFGSKNKFKSYEFDIRDDVKWSNGEKVTAEDFVYQISKLSLAETDFYGFLNGYFSDKEDSKSIFDGSALGSLSKTIEDAEESYLDDTTKTSTEVDGFLSSFNTSFDKANLITDKKSDEAKTYLDDLKVLVDIVENVTSFKIELDELKNFFDNFSTSSFVTRIKSGITSEADKNKVDEIISAFNPSTWRNTLSTNLSTSDDVLEKLVVKLGKENYKDFNSEHKANASTLIAEYKKVLANGVQIKEELTKFNKFYSDFQNLVKESYKSSIDNVQSFMDPLSTNTNDGKAHITIDFLGFPASYLQVVDVNRGEVTYENNTRAIKELTPSESNESSRLNKGETVNDSIKYYFDPLLGTEINTMCTSPSTDYKATTWKGAPLKFSDVKGGKINSYETIQDLCDSFTLIYSTDNNSKLRIKLANGFRTSWLFELFSTSVIFLPMNEKFLTELGDGNDAVGITRYANDDESFLHNGIFGISDVSLTEGYTLTKNELNPLSELTTIPGEVKVRFTSTSSASARTLAYLSKSNVRATLNDIWYDTLKDTTPEQISIENGSPTGSAWWVNKLSPTFTNEYFRTKVGEKIDWGTGIGELEVKEYKLSPDRLECEEVTAEVPTYPTVNEDNYICGLPAEFRDFSRQKRMLISSLFDNGRSSYEIQNLIYSYATETWTPSNWAKDNYERDYSEIVGDAIEELKNNPIDITDSSYDKIFTKKGETTPLTDEERKNISYYTNNDYDGANKHLWRSSRKVGFTAFQTRTEAPTRGDDYTPSFNLSYAKETWKILKEKFPQWTGEKENLFFFSIGDAAFDNFRLRVKEGWLDNIGIATDGDITADLKTITLREGAPAIFFGANTPRVLNCGQGDLKADYDLDKDSICARNLTLVGLAGWSPDYSDPTNFYGSAVKGQSNGSYMYASDIPTYIIEWFRQRIIALTDKDLSNGKFDEAQANIYKKEVNDLLGLAINIPENQNKPIIDLGSILKTFTIKTPNGDVKGLNSISEYSRLKILGFYEGWMLNEGYLAPYTGTPKSPVAQIISGSFNLKGIVHYENAFRCDISTSVDRTYVSNSGEKKTTKIDLPSCFDYRVINAAISADFKN